MVVCTATASGKSLCYNLPILEALAQDRRATALYMFPTKALAQDQLRALRELCDWTFGEGAPFVDIYDGDTPKASTAGSRNLLRAPQRVSHRAYQRVTAGMLQASALSEKGR